MKRRCSAAAALFLAVAVLFCACSCGKQEDSGTVKMVEGTVRAVDAQALTLETGDRDRYLFDLTESRLNTAQADLVSGARAAVFYTGTLDPKQEKQSGVLARTVTVTAAADGWTAAESTLRQAEVRLVSNMRFPSRAEYADALAWPSGAALQTVWRNDEAVFPLTVFAARTPLEQVSVRVSDLRGDAGVIAGEAADRYFLRETQGYVGNATNALETELLKESFPDILDTQDPTELPAGTLKNVWVSVPVPSGTAPGLYAGTIFVESPSLAQSMTVAIQIQVLGLEVPSPDDFLFDIELWQYPYRIAQYYGLDPFGEEHIRVLKQHMERYREIGGHAITASIVEEPWNAQTYGQYPSMIKWTKEKDGAFSFDFTDFDKWVTLCKEIGIGDKIVCYSLIPWGNQITYFDAEAQAEKSVAPKPGTRKYKKLWTEFLEALAAHTDEKGWFDDIYIGIDERENMEKAFSVVEDVRGKNGNSFHISAAMNHFSADYFPVIDRVSSVSVGSESVKPAADDYRKLIERRRADPSLETTIYTCTGHFPNSFVYSMPMESYWVMLYCGRMGSTGFLRWALDAWVEAPLQDVSYQTFEAGDCFLLYPDEADSPARETKASVRFEMLKKGVRDVNKLAWLAGQGDTWRQKVDELYATLKLDYTNLGDGIAGKSARETLPSDMEVFQAQMNALFAQYEQAGG